MEQEKLYDFSILDCVHNNLNLCEQKETVLNLLKTSKPKQVKKFKYHIYWDFDIGYHIIQIENAELEINTVTQELSDIAKFILRVAYYSSSQLLCSINDECLYTAIITTPVDENKIRVSITNEFGWYIKNAKILSDFIIERKIFIEQFNNIFKEYLNGIRKESYAYKEVSLITKKLDLYLGNPEEFHNKFKLENYIRVFDIAYKDLDKNWKFVLYNSFDLKAEDEDKTTISYWQKLKDEKKILDFDFLEHDAIEEEDIDELLKTDYYTRIDERNWAYSKHFDKFYSSDEPMDCHINSENILHKNLSFKIDVNLDYRGQTKEAIIKECNLTKCYEGLNCDLVITDECSNSIYKISFPYKNLNKIEKVIKNLKEKKYIRIYVDYDNNERRLHLWYDNKDNVKLSLIKEYSFAFYTCEQEEIFNLAIDGKTFINGVLNAFKEFKNDLKTYK